MEKEGYYWYNGVIKLLIGAKKTMGKIKINKLFGKYTNEVDLSKRCVILIGENGVGKSTTANILKCIATWDFVEITKYYFESVTFSSDGGDHTVEYAQFFPPLKMILEEMADAAPGFVSACGDRGPEDVLSEIHNKLEANPKVFYQFVAASYFNRPVNQQIKRMLLPLLRLFVSGEEVDIESVVYKAIRKLIKSHKSRSHVKLFDHAAIEEAMSDGLYKVIEDLGLSPCHYFDVVNWYSIDSSLQGKSYVYSHTVSWLNSYDRMFPGSCSCEKEAYKLGLPKNIDAGDELISIAKKEYANPNYLFNHQDTKAEFLKKLCAHEMVDVNKLIQRLYYPDSFIKEINDIAAGYYTGLIGTEWNECTGSLNGDQVKEIEHYLFETDFISNVQYYFKPVVLGGCPFDIDFSEVAEEYLVSGTGLNPFYSAFLRFYEREFDKLRSYQNEKIAKLQELLSKYMTNKDVLVTPSGIIVRKKLAQGDAPLTLGEDPEIPLDMLSSGEKKIILLFMLALFYEGTTLIIDEPELSLSLIWQEQLLPDLLENTSIKRIIVATHSPFIATDESLMEFLLPLPTEE